MRQPQLLIKIHKNSWHDTASYMTHKDRFHKPNPSFTPHLKSCLISSVLALLLSTMRTKVFTSLIFDISKKWFLPKYTTTDSYLFNPDIKFKYFSSSVELYQGFSPSGLHCGMMLKRRQEENVNNEWRNLRSTPLSTSEACKRRNTYFDIKLNDTRMLQPRKVVFPREESPGRIF